MDFETIDNNNVDDERNPVNILQLSSTPPSSSSPPSGELNNDPSSLVRNVSRHTTILRSRRATQTMPVLSSSPTTIALQQPPSESPQPPSNIVPQASIVNSSTTTPTDTTTTTNISQQSSPSPPLPSLPPASAPIKVVKDPRKHPQHCPCPSSSPREDQDLIITSNNDTPPNRQSMPLDISDFECPLCFQVFFQPVTTTCGHVFCKQCLFRAIKHSPSCPLCRYKIDSSSTHQKYPP